MRNLTLYLTVGITALSACRDTLAHQAGSVPAVEGSSSGFVTAQPAQARALAPQATLRPLLTSGDLLPGSGLPWDPVPDGLGAFMDGGDLVVFANHEINATGVASDNGGPAIRFSRVSRLRIDPFSLAVVSGDYVEDGSGGYQRLCSATWAGTAEGLSGYFLTGEEQGVTDKGSMTLAFSSSGQRTELPHLGAMSHENTVVVPGFGGKVVAMGTDDSNGASELYMYVAADEAAFLAGQGHLYVLKTDALSTAGNPLHAGNMTEGQTIPAYFVEVPDPADLGTAPNLRFANLQTKVDALGAMPFVRLEDGDYDRSPGASAGKPAFFFVDTGNGATSGRSQIGADCGGVCDLAGSIYRLDLNPVAPTTGARLTLLVRSRGVVSGWASPDNIATSSKSLMVMEDPAYTGFDGSRPPAIWNFRLLPHGRLGGVRKVAEVTQEELIHGPAGKCVDALNQCWETSGIISTESALGSGTWLFNVQAHTLPFRIQGGTGSYASESGQLLYLRLPGS